MPKDAVREITHVHRTALFARISLLVFAMGVYALAVVFVDQKYLHAWPAAHSTIHGMLGLVLGALLVFRTNTAYDRWWEGRKLWGQLLNDSRNLAIKVRTCVRAPDEDKQLFARRLASFAIALKDHLRDGCQLQSLDGFENSTEHPPHVPGYVAATLYQQLENWRIGRKLGSIELLFLDQHAASLMNICGACERILKTPISSSWRMFIRQGLTIYLLTMPWGLSDDLVYWTVPTAVLVAYFMIGMETIAEDVEQPFGLDEDDLKLDEICETIRRSVLTIMKEAIDASDLLPPTVQPPIAQPTVQR